MQHVYRTIIIIIKNKICTASSSCTSACAFRLRAGFPRGSLAGAARSCAGAPARLPDGSPPAAAAALGALVPSSAPRFTSAKRSAAAAIPLQSTKQCAFISFVKYARNANHSDQTSPHQRSIKVIVKVKNRILLLW